MVSQKLDVSWNGLPSLPHELSRLGNLKELVAHNNCLPTVPVSVLMGMTALTDVDLHHNCWRGSVEEPMFKIPSPLLPILHPGLLKLDLRAYAYKEDFTVAPTGQVTVHHRVPFEWDSVSLFHLARATVEVADRRPRPTLLFDVDPPELLPNGSL
jgi:hypothetical protein